MRTVAKIVAILLSMYMSVVVLAAPKEDRRRFMLHAHETGMTNGDYVFFTVDMLPDEEVINPDGRPIETISSRYT